MRALLIDDEIDSLEALGILLERYCPSVEQVGHCRSADEGLQAIKERDPDLLFLDIEMPGKNGFQMLEELEEKHLEVIFVTAYDQYAMNAIKVSAMDYLLKPVDEEELVRAVDKARQRLEARQSSEQLEVLLTNIRSGEKGFQKLAIPSVDGLQFVNVSDILYCSAEGNYTTIHCVNDEQHVISKTLKDTTALLSNPSFFRTHQSYLVNLNYLKRYIKGSGGNVVLQDGSIIQVARARKEALMKLIYQ
ncbi:MAG: LytTR family DNA-binding domain-containing protein [Saprospiraceae bacterium]|nr:LytTR family DNA-binding domain-containing protein [Saprospiraceae bacterium]